MRLKLVVVSLAIVSGVLFSACKIQEAPGAYEPAKSVRKPKKLEEEKPVVKVVEEKEPERPVVVPAPMEEDTVEQVMAAEIERAVEPKKVDTVPAIDTVQVIEVEKVDTIKLDTARVETLTKPVPVAIPVESNPAAIVEQAPEPELTRAEKFTVVNAQDKSLLRKYHVVIGSFGVQANADRLKESMNVDYTPIVVKNEKGLYRVILISYDDYKSAKEEIVNIHSQFKDAWVLINAN